MTSRITEIQTLVADIDNFLANKVNRLPKILPGQGQEPRQLLERVRHFLVELAESDAQGNSQENQREQQYQLSPLLAKFVDQSHQVPSSGDNQPNPQESTFVESSQINKAFSALLMPLQAELQTLLQERATLIQEIRQLEQKRLQNYSLAQQMATQEKMISEFLQVLMNRLMASLAPSRGETTANPTQSLRTIDASSLANQKGKLELTFSSGQSSLESPEQVERLTRLAKELDEQLLALDGTVNVVFEALQRNIHTYDESLSQALARMHSKGMQGEQLLVSWINNVLQQLQQQTAINNAFTSNVENKLLASASETTEATPNSLEIAQVSTSLPVDSYQQPSLEPFTDASSTQELDAMLLQLNQDTQNSTFNVHTHPDDSEVVGDEVDQLYASLFGTDDLTDSSLDSDSTPEVTDVSNSSSVDSKMPPSAPEMTEVLDEGVSDHTIEQVVDTTDEPPVETTDSSVENPPLPTLHDETQAEDEPPVETTDSSVENPPLPTLHDETQAKDEPPVETTDSSVENPPLPTLHDETQAKDEPPVEITDSSVENSLPPTPHDETQAKDEPPVEITDSSVENPPLTSEVVKDPTTHEVHDEVTDTTHEPLTDPHVSDQIQQVEDAPVIVPDPWFDEPDAGLLNAHNFDTQDNSFQATEQLSDSDNKLISDENIDSTTTSSLVEPPAGIYNQDLETPSNNYTPASPKENLLAQEEESATTVPEISLEEAQLRQLEQDLINFDATQNIQLQPATSGENQALAANTPTNLEASGQVDTQLEVSTAADQVNEAEKKQEVSTDKPESSSVSVSKPLDNTELSKTLDSVWYLGVDLGTTGISAALLNRSTVEIYPLYWSAENPPAADSIKHSFRLPAEVYLPNASVTPGETESKEDLDKTIPAAVAEEHASKQQSASAPGQNHFSAQLKPYLQVALPYKDEQHKWEPVLQLNEVSTVPLVWVVRSLSKLLLTLKSDSGSTTLNLTAGAVGLSQHTFYGIIDNLAGVICTCPSNWSEQYRFNVREALLTSKLVRHPQQVFFIEEAIASLLSELDGANGETVELNTYQGSRLAKTSDYPLIGNTLVINIGAACTEMALVDLPEHLDELTHSDFMLHGFAYAGKGIEQDIICQLLFSTKWRQSRTDTQAESNGDTSHPWPWQSSIPGLDEMQLSNIAWGELNLPRPGEPDISDRIRLQQRLEGSLLGKAMLDAAIALKLILQHQDSFTLELADQQWILNRRDLESQVFVPFVRRLNRELNRLLVAKGIPTEAINQAILTGGVASIGAVNRWLRQKLPNARIIQDFYLGDNGEPSCSRVAYGLAVLPLHPQVVEVSRQQYTDYFLFTELLSLLPERSLSFDEVIQLFENRGINTRNCQQRLLAFLEGELPPGLIPSSLNSHWLTSSAKENPDYQAISAAPLFEKQGNLTYCPNPQQLQSFCRYLNIIKASTQQSLEEPYTVNFAVGVVH